MNLTPHPLRITYLTAGAAGMYCGSCMHDNTLARALSQQGVDVQLIPTYTPIRTDEENVSVDQVFFGGINVFLQERVPLFRHLPRLVGWLLDRPGLIRLATSRGVDIRPEHLGALTVSMLRGAAGHQAGEVRRLCDWLQRHSHPHLLTLTNVLIAGFVPELKRRLDVPVLVTLQGDDIFLDGLVEPYRQQAFDEIRRLVEHIDGFLVFSRYYAEYMADYLGIPPEKIHRVPLGIDTTPFAAFDESLGGGRGGDAPPTIGYLARLAPEKGLHLLVDAFLALRQRTGMEHVRLRVAGWLGEQQQGYAHEHLARLKQAGVPEEDAVYLGSVDQAGKLDLLRSIDVLSVPTVYRDPKGLFVLEALAAGVPVVQPAHGAFPELLAAAPGGRLVTPGDPSALADALYQLLLQHEVRRALGRAGREAVLRDFNARVMAERTLDVFRQFAPLPR